MGHIPFLCCTFRLLCDWKCPHCLRTADPQCYRRVWQGDVSPKTRLAEKIREFPTGDMFWQSSDDSTWIHRTFFNADTELSQDVFLQNKNHFLNSRVWNDLNGEVAIQAVWPSGVRCCMLTMQGYIFSTWRLETYQLLCLCHIPVATSLVEILWSGFGNTEILLYYKKAVLKYLK